MMNLMKNDHEHGSDQQMKIQSQPTPACQLKPVTTACLYRQVNLHQRHHPLAASNAEHASNNSHPETNSIGIWRDGITPLWMITTTDLASLTRLTAKAKLPHQRSQVPGGGVETFSTYANTTNVNATGLGGWSPPLMRQPEPKPAVGRQTLIQ